LGCIAAILPGAHGGRQQYVIGADGWLTSVTGTPSLISTEAGYALATTSTARVSGVLSIPAPNGDAQNLSIVARVKSTHAVTADEMAVCVGSSTTGREVAVGFGSGGVTSGFIVTNNGVGSTDGNVRDDFVTLGVTRTASVVSVWEDGAKIAQTGVAGTLAYTGTVAIYLGSYRDGTRPFTGNIAWVFVFARALTNADHWLAANEPWTLLEPDTDLLSSAVPSAGGTTISLDVVSAISFVSAITTTPRILTALNGYVANDTISSVELSATANGDTAARIGFLSGQIIDLIVPAATMTALNSDGASVIDFLENISSDKISPVEFGASVVGDKVFLVESGRGVRGEQLSPTQILGSVQKTDRAPLEWAGTVVVSLSADHVVPVDFTTSIRSDIVPPAATLTSLNGRITVADETGALLRSDTVASQEFGLGIGRTSRTPDEIGAGVRSDAIAPTEWSGTVVISINGDTVSPIEFGTGVRNTTRSAAALISNLRTDSIVNADTLSKLVRDVLGIVDTAITARYTFRAPLEIEASAGSSSRIRIEWTSDSPVLIAKVNLQATQVTISLKATDAQLYLKALSNTDLYLKAGLDQ